MQRSLGIRGLGLPPLPPELEGLRAAAANAGDRKRAQALAPSLPLNEWFMRIVHEGTGKTFAPEDNQHWLSVTRPILEAFFHARYFLHMAVKCGKESKAPPRMMPSGYAALLYLYSFR